MYSLDNSIMAWARPAWGFYISRRVRAVQRILAGCLSGAGRGYVLLPKSVVVTPWLPHSVLSFAYPDGERRRHELDWVNRCIRIPQLPVTLLLVCQSLLLDPLFLLQQPLVVLDAKAFPYKIVGEYFIIPEQATPPDRC